MRYFTPELLERLNRDEDMDEADRAWDLAVSRYRRRLKKLRPGLPRHLRRFLDEECLHDADMIGMIAPDVDVFNEGRYRTHLLVRQDNRLLTLNYHGLVTRPEFRPVCYPRHRNELQPLWLYDEVDMSEAGSLEHRIFFSSGYTLHLVCGDFNYSAVEILQPTERSISPGAVSASRLVPASE